MADDVGALICACSGACLVTGKIYCSHSNDTEATAMIAAAEQAGEVSMLSAAAVNPAAGIDAG